VQSYGSSAYGGAAYTEAEQVVRELIRSVDRQLIHRTSTSRSGPDTTLDEARRIVAASGLDRVQLRGLAEDVATHLEGARSSGTFTVRDWETSFGVGSDQRASRRSQVRDDVDFGLGAMDATRMPGGVPPFRTWQESDLARLLGLHLVGYLRLRSRGFFPSRDVDALVSRCASRLAVATSFVEPTGLPPGRDHALAVGIDVVDDETIRGPLAIGAVIGDDVNGRYVVVGDFASPGTRSHFVRLEVLEPPRSDHYYAVGVSVGDRCLLKLHPSDVELTQPQDLPVSAFVMGPIARLRVGSRHGDVLPLADVDLYAWWRTQAAAGRRLDSYEVLALAAPMAAGLAALHGGRGDKVAMVHGDVKLSQFLIGNTLQISDLEMAVATSGQQEARSSVPAKGHTLGYLPPDGDPDMTSRRRDSWALGVCWHLLLTGVHPAEVVSGRAMSNYDRCRAVWRGHWAIGDDVHPSWRSILEGLLKTGSRRRPAAVLTELLAMDTSVRDAPTAAAATGVLASVELGDGTRLVTARGGDETCTVRRVRTDGTSRVWTSRAVDEAARRRRV